MELNYFDHYEILEKLENRLLNKIIETLKINKNSTIKIKLDNKHYIIIHKSSKKADQIQVSYFDKAGAYADKETSSIKEALKLFNVYNLKNNIIEVL